MSGHLGMALRRLWRRPVVTVVTIATLAVGLGATTAIFSVARAVVLQPLPYAQPDRLVLVWQNDRERGQPFVEMSYPTFRDWRAQHGVFEDLAGLSSTNQDWTLTGHGEPARVTGRLVSWNFFNVLGVAPALGRVLLPDDDRRGAERVVVLSHALWRTRLGGDPDIVGRSVVLDDERFTVVGVMPASIAFPAAAELWTPVVPGVSELAEQPGVWWMSGLGRLRSGIPLEQARREMTSLTSAYNREKYQEPGVTAVLTPLAEGVLGPVRPVLLALLGGVGLVLLVACANVAALQAVAVDERAGELAVRMALGASATRLARELMVESLAVAAIGGGFGVLAAVAGVPLVIALAPQDVPRLANAGVNLPVLAFAIVAILATGILTALAPIIAARRRSPRDALLGASRQWMPGGSRVRFGLVAGEVALALVLLVGAGLLLRSFAALLDVPLGYQPENLLAAEAGPSEKDYPQAAQQRAYVDELLGRLRALPDVEAAAAVTLRPLWGTVGMDWHFAVEGQSAVDAQRNPLVNFETVTPDYFRAMRIPVRLGRAFDQRDRDGQPGVVIVSETFARRAWPGQDPIGKRLKIPLPPTEYHDAWLTVVGLAGDARYRELTAARLDLYMSHQQSDHRPRHVVVRTRGNTADAAAAIARVVRESSPGQPAPGVIAMKDAVAEAVAVPRFAVRVLSAFAALAVLLASLGVYGVVAGSVGRRTREIGMRVILGAQPLAIARLVVLEGLRPAAAGMALGLGGALAAGRTLSSLLFGVGPTDLVTMVAASGLLIVVTLAATAVPTWRALRLQPADTLREG